MPISIHVSHTCCQCPSWWCRGQTPCTLLPAPAHDFAHHRLHLKVPTAKRHEHLFLSKLLHLTYVVCMCEYGYEYEYEYEYVCVCVCV